MKPFAWRDVLVPPTAYPPPGASKFRFSTPRVTVGANGAFRLGTIPADPGNVTRITVLELQNAAIGCQLSIDQTGLQNMSLHGTDGTVGYPVPLIIDRNHPRDVIMTSSGSAPPRDSRINMVGWSWRNDRREGTLFPKLRGLPSSRFLPVGISDRVLVNPSQVLQVLAFPAMPGFDRFRAAGFVIDTSRQVAAGLAITDTIVETPAGLEDLAGLAYFTGPQSAPCPFPLYHEIPCSLAGRFMYQNLGGTGVNIESLLLGHFDRDDGEAVPGLWYPEPGSDIFHVGTPPAGFTSVGTTETPVLTFTTPRKGRGIRAYLFYAAPSQSGNTRNGVWRFEGEGLEGYNPMRMPDDAGTVPIQLTAWLRPGKDYRITFQRDGAVPTLTARCSLLGWTLP